VEAALSAPRAALAGAPAQAELQPRPEFPVWRQPSMALGNVVSDVGALWSRPADPAGRVTERHPTEPTPGGVAARTHPTNTEFTNAEPLPEGDWPLGRAIAQLQGIYILAENAQGLVVVDMHAAHERIVYERLKTQMDAQAIRSQPLLIPATFSATPGEVATAEACEAALEALGLQITPFSPRTLAVRAVPAALANGDAVELARSVLAELAQHDASSVVERAATNCCPPWPATAPCVPTAS